MNIKHEPVVDIYEMKRSLVRHMGADHDDFSLLDLFFDDAEDGSYRQMWFDEDTISDAEDELQEEIKYYETHKEEDDEDESRWTHMIRQKISIMKALNELYPTYDYFLVHIYW